MLRIAVLLLVLLATAAQGQQVGYFNPTDSTPTTLYFHLSANQDFPINTQIPAEGFAQSDSRGLLGSTLTCTTDPTGQVNKAFHTLYGFSTPGYVEYDFIENGRPRIHPERGISADVKLDSSAPAEVVFYIQAKPLGGGEIGGQDLNELPTLVPEVLMEATVREGDDVSVGKSAYEQGRIVAHGTSPTQLLNGQINSEAEALADGTFLYKFTIPLVFEGDPIISREEAFNVRVDIRMNIPTCDSRATAIMLGQVQWYSDSTHRPLLNWSILNGIYTEYLHPEFVGDQLFFHMGFNSPWGNYDVDENPGGITVTITGPSTATRLTQAALEQKFHEHGFHQDPVAVTYVWPYKLDEATRGEYSVRVEAWNDQHTAQAAAVASFKIGPNTATDANGNLIQPTTGGSKESPIGVPLVLIAAIGAALIRRRSDSS